MTQEDNEELIIKEEDANQGQEEMLFDDDGEDAENQDPNKKK